MYSTLKSRPCSRPFSHHTTPNSPLYFLPSTPYFCPSPHLDSVVDPIRGWSRLIRFFKPKSATPSTPNPSSRCDVDFIVARRNRFIQKFARTPWPSFILLFFSGPDGFATVNEQMYYPPYTADAILLFAPLPTSFLSLSLSLAQCIIYVRHISSFHLYILLSVTYS